MESGGLECHKLVHGRGEEGGCVDILPNTKSRGTLRVIKFYMKFRLKFSNIYW